MTKLFLGLAQYQQGKAQKKQLFRQAGAARATSQRESVRDRKQSLLLQSRALAVAAASGGGVDDPTVSKLRADIAAQGEINALNTLWEGNEESAGLMAEGEARKNEGRMRAYSTILSMGEDAMKYGGG
jgi:hypothetical protein